MLAKLIVVLIMVESGGNVKAIGDHGKAYGCLQIHEEVVKDVNRVYHTKYTHKDAFDKNKSIDMCEKYIRIYTKSNSYETCARIWNGGPGGYKNSSTLGYWKKVKQQTK